MFVYKFIMRGVIVCTQSGDKLMRVRKRINLDDLHYCGCRVPLPQPLHLGTTSVAVGLQGQEDQPAPPIQAVTSGGT